MQECCDADLGARLLVLLSESTECLAIKTLLSKKQRNCPAQPGVPLPQPASLTNLSGFVSDAG